MITAPPPNSAKPMTVAALNPLVIECVQLHERLHRAELYETAHKMNEVVRAIGWEIARKLP